jgi:hypothetical protein
MASVIYVTMLCFGYFGYSNRRNELSALDPTEFASMNNVTSAYQEAVSSLIRLQLERKVRLPPMALDSVNRILNDVQRRLSKIEPMLKDS